MLPEGKKSANGSESLPDENDELEKESQDEGEKSQKSSEQLLKEYKAENKRKSDELKATKAQLEEIKASKEERLEELENKPRLTRSEQEEVAMLEQQIVDIERDQRSKPWLEVNRRLSEKVAQDKTQGLAFQLAEEMAEDYADKEGIDPDEFKDKLTTYLRKHRDEPSLTKRVRLAYKDYAKEIKQEKELEEFRRYKKGEEIPREVSRSARPASKKDLLDNAQKTGNWKDVLSTLEEVQAEERRKL